MSPFEKYRAAWSTQRERERDALARELARNGGAHQRKRHRLRWPWRLEYTPPAAGTRMCMTPGDCPNGPDAHPFVGPELALMCCCRQPWEDE